MSPSPVERLAAELRTLYEAAGKPTLDSVVDRAARHQPPVKLTTSTLSDWLAGTSVPRNPGPFQFVIAHLQRGVARRPNAGHRARPVEWWTNS